VVVEFAVLIAVGKYIQALMPVSGAVFAFERAQGDRNIVLGCIVPGKMDGADQPVNNHGCLVFSGKFLIVSQPTG